MGVRIYMLIWFWSWLDLQRWNRSRFFVDFLWMTSFSICFYLRWCMYLQFALWFIRRIMYRTNTNRPGHFPLVRWYIERITKWYSAKIPIHGSASSTYGSCSLYVCTRFPATWCILSIVAFACGFPEEYDLVLIIYSFSIKVFKLVVKELSSLVIRNFHWPWISDHPRSINCHQFIITVLHDIKPPGYGVYHCKGF